MRKFNLDNHKMKYFCTQKFESLFMDFKYRQEIFFFYKKKYQEMKEEGYIVKL